jgi:hypothetical protein
MRIHRLTVVTRTAIAIRSGRVKCDFASVRDGRRWFRSSLFITYMGTCAGYVAWIALVFV